MTIAFTAGESWRCRRPGVDYVVSEFSVSPFAREETEVVVLLNELGILIDVRNEVVGLSGYFPITEWLPAKLEIPPSERRVVSVRDEAFEMTGIPSRLGRKRWPIWNDLDARTVRVGTPSGHDVVVIEAVEGVFFGLDESRESLVAIWISDVP